MSECKSNVNIKEHIVSLITVENLQKYVFGTKKSGHPRAIYDIIKKWDREKVKKKKDKNTSNLYLSIRRKKKKKKKKDKDWKF